MNISYNWLSELVEIKINPKELAEKLTMVGFAVDGVVQHGDDYVLEIDLTSNRPDGLCHLGIAREAALVCGTALKPLNLDLKENDEAIEQLASIEIHCEDLCPRYAARIVKGVTVGESPDWLKQKLEAVGQRPVNNIADISNYVMFELGQPNHAFDLNTLSGKKIIVRRAVEGEKLQTLDGVERLLTTEMCIIADADRAIAIGGVMGGEETEISSKTTDVLIESAYFNPASIRATGKALGMGTEASYRYERGMDYDSQVRVANRVAQLISEIAGGEIVKGVIDVYPNKIERDPVRLRESRIGKLTGLRVSLENAVRILTSLQFAVEPVADRSELLAVAPSFRIDVSREEDLVEEVARHFGYEKIATTLPDSVEAGRYLESEGRRRATRNTLVDSGFNEAISFSFVNGESDTLFREANQTTPKLSNPIDVSEAEMRASLMTGLLSALQRNFFHGRRDVKLFELGRVFKSIQTGERPDEREVLGVVMSGALTPDTWRDNRQMDFYDLKGVIESIMGSLRISGFTIERASVEYLHPGQSAELNKDGMVVARFGRLHPKVASLYKFRQPVYVGEIEFGKLIEFAADEVRYKPLPKFPSISRDISALLPDTVSWGEIETAIKELGIGEIISIAVFDMYKGKEMQAGTRSLAFRVVYRSDERTLTDDEVSALHQRIRDLMEQRFSAQLR